MTLRLSETALAVLPPDVARPRHFRAGVAGIVHLGIGAFHRAHQAVYVDDLLAHGVLDWRIRGVSLRSPAVRDQLAPQDGLYTLVEQSRAGERLRVIGSIADVLVAPERPASVIEAIAAPETHIVTLTVTEKGYCHEPATGALDVTHADIAHDLAAEVPRSAIGYLAAGLDQRRRLGTPLTLMSCDNLPHNGAVLRRVLVEFADRRDASLARWIEANVAFPATMVDRIVPATTVDDVDRLEACIGVRDEAMVKTEPFTQWVIEDRFTGARPPFESAGAQVIADVRPFELAKLRMLNGSHSTIAYLGLLAGHSYVHEAIGDRAIARVVERLMVEAASTLLEVPGFDTGRYARDLVQRFGNPALRHQLKQIAMDGSQKLPQRLLQTIEALAMRGEVANAAACGVAGWMLHLRGPYVNDPLGERLRTIAAAAGDDPERLVGDLLAVRQVFGDLGNRSSVRRLVAAEVRSLAQAEIAA